MNDSSADILWNNFERAFRPRSVAILGASNDATRISGRALHYMKKAGYQGRIYPVNPSRETVQEIKAYASLDAVPEVPDMVLICIAAEKVKDAIRECVAKGVGAAVIYASGFAETGEAGKQLQQEIRALADAGGLRVFGPNCLGLLSTQSGFIGTFSSAFDDGFVSNGNVAVVSQSGAYGGHLAYLCRERNVGIGYWVSTGNELNTDVADCIKWLACQDDVSVIMAFAEGIRDGDKFIDALRTAHERRKAVIFGKVGGSEAGSVAATSHTASLAGSDEVYDAVFRQYGVYRARTTEEHVDLAYACSRGVYPLDRRLGIITVSGGFGIQLCDAADRYGLEVPPLPPASQEKLKTINPFGGAGNPCDTTAGVLNDMSIISKTFRVMYEEGGYGSVIGSFTMLPASPTYGARMCDAIQAGTVDYKDRPTLLCMAAGKEVIRSYEEAGFLVYSDSDRAALAVSALAYLKDGFDKEINVPDIDLALRRDIGAQMLSEAAAQRLLAGAGLPFLPSGVVCSAEAAVTAAESHGYPVVMKIVSPDILHKTEIGGVILNVDSADACRSAYQTLIERAGTKAPHAHIEGVLVTPMAPKGIETIMGVNRDPVFGPVVMFGLGGIFTELFEDVSFRIAPFDESEARRMIEETRAYGLLKGFRGKPAADIDALARTLAQLSQFAAANADQISSIDLNPVVALEAGRGVFALDAVIVPGEK
jgi:acyl-CoA synthetase (NDP forming)